jgi:hypothetical protein
VPARRLELTRDQVLRHRRSAGGLEARAALAPDALRRAAWAGLQDSVPRAALLSIHARVEGAGPTTWEDPTLVQLWGPRFSAYVVAERDAWVFSLGRLPDDPAARRRAEETAERLDAFLAGRSMSYADAGHALGQGPNSLRYAAPTGRVRIRWEGARRPTIWTVPRPDVDPAEARLELARRYLHVFGPGTPDAFAGWAGVKTTVGRASFDRLAGSLTAVRTPLGEGWILAADEASFRIAPAAGGPMSTAGARLLPSGDAYYLLHGADRALLVPEADRRAALWTPRVWPGAVLLGGELVGTWRRADADLTIEPWRPLSGPEREVVVAEAESLPLPGVAEIRVRWVG